MKVDNDKNDDESNNAEEIKAAEEDKRVKIARSYFERGNYFLSHLN